MRIPVVIELLAGGKRFRARSSEPFAVTTEADSRDAALGQIGREIEHQMRTREVVYLEVPTPPGASSVDFPTDENDPRMLEYRECLAEARKELEDVLSRISGPEDEE
jgi:hypothetical protein